MKCPIKNCPVTGKTYRCNIGKANDMATCPQALARQLDATQRLVREMLKYSVLFIPPVREEFTKKAIRIGAVKGSK